MKSVILTVGLNRTTAPIQIRERISTARCARDDVQDSLPLHSEPSQFPETFAHSTCSHREIHAVAFDRQHGERALKQNHATHELLPASAGYFSYLNSDRGGLAHTCLLRRQPGARAASGRRRDVGHRHRSRAQESLTNISRSQFEAPLLEVSHAKSAVSRTKQNAAHVLSLNR